ncbi:amidophosphoribosyltransferase [Gelria sp. Kuro-4]|uniref:amidophosphoribosyltransferase n=1 Tax=Gelria sp. Kuro-4 TaxID=2796927 RepID=UPI001BEF0A64|nr:amidophosphoribosyltransferase [Gelria sp. Kuro-4]BCV24467.1 amidophosphoribosyltransferase [Gelria sp. Kuro-4]
MPPLEADKLHEECGVFGVYAPGEDVGRLTYMGLFALQHRGQESAGIAVTDGRSIALERGLGLVGEVFNEKLLAGLQGKIAIGHVRYSTAGGGGLNNAQPLAVASRRGSLALAHNGNLVNAAALREELSERGYLFQTTSDTEVIASLTAQAEARDTTWALISALSQVEGSFALVVLTPDRLLGVRDPHGMRPLCLGRLGSGHVLASESCALDTVGAQFVRDVEPGELVSIGPDGVSSIRYAAPHKAFCIFEFIYFARPDSRIEGVGVHEARRRAGRRLAQEWPAAADLVVPVPDSGISAALGYAEASGIPYAVGLIKNRYVGRTFIQPAQKTREFGVHLKLNPIREVLDGRRIVLVDDSIVRGTTSRRIVRLLRSAGAREVHVRVSSPPIVSPCYYGIDTPTTAELIGARCPVEEIRRAIDADSLGYLSLDGLKEAVGLPGEPYCLACFNGNYLAGRCPREGGEPDA